jgi:hypothetical protein
MGRLAHQRTRTVDLGPCECPNNPHDRDTAVILEEMGVRDNLLVGEAGLAAAADRGGYNTGAAEAKLIELGTVSWTIQDEEGNPTEPTQLWIGRLDAVTFGILAAECAQALKRAQAPLSKGRGGRSPTPSPASGSRTPMTPKPPAPTAH